MSLSLGIHLKSMLSANKAVSNLVSDRIYPISAPESTDFPFLVYSDPNVSAFYTKESTDNYGLYDDDTYDVICVSKSYDEAVKLSEAVRDVLENTGYSDSDIDIEESDLISSSGSLEGDLYIKTLNFSTRTNYKN